MQAAGVPRLGSPPTEPRPDSLVHVAGAAGARSDAAAVPRGPARAAGVAAGPARRSRGCTRTSATGSTSLRAGRDVMLATGTASGKSLVYQTSRSPRRRSTHAEGDRAVPVPDEGAGARPAARDARAQAAAGPRRGLRRRHAAGGAPADPAQREPRADEPGHAAPVAARRPRALGRLPVAARRRRGRRGARAARRVRLARGDGAAAAAAADRARTAATRAGAWPAPRSGTPASSPSG